MPVVGAMGAISAAHRAQRRRRDNMGMSGGICRGSSNFQSEYQRAKDAKAKAEAHRIQCENYLSAKSSKATDSSTWETVSVDSKSSVLTKLKQQMQETGGFLKKKQQAFAEKVQKGIKMTSSTFTQQRNQDTEAQEAVSPIDPLQQQKTREMPETSRKAWLDTLELMGFERIHIKEAISTLGGKARSIDDVVELLVANAAKSSSSGASSSQTFSISLKKGANDQLGITVGLGPWLTVEEVASKGLVPSWNASHPDLSVKAGDHIVEVNGVTGNPDQLLKAMSNTPSITMSISSRGSTKSLQSVIDLRSSAAGATDPDRHVSDSMETPQESSEESNEVGLATLENPQEAKEEEDEEEEEEEAAGVEEVTEEVSEDPQEAKEEDLVEDAEATKPGTKPTVPITVEGADLADEVDIPDLVAKVVGFAFAQASNRLLLNDGADAPAAAPKHAVEECPPTSPVRGGA